VRSFPFQLPRESCAQKRRNASTAYSQKWATYENAGEGVFPRGRDWAER
jgi:hypothetical protein